MPTLADREDWDESSASQEEFGGWDEDWDEEHDWQFDYDWLDDWEERREETYREFAEQGQRKDAWGRLQGGPGERGVSARRRVSLFIINSSNWASHTYCKWLQQIELNTLVRGNSR